MSPLPLSGQREGPHGTSVLWSLSAVLFLFLLVPGGSRDQDKPCPFPASLEDFAEGWGGISVLGQAHLQLPPDFLMGRAELAPPNKPKPPSYPLPASVHLQSPDISSPTAKAGPG